MSRNLRQKNTGSPAQKVSKARRHSFEDSTDDDYGGVDQISDSEEDEPDVEVAEEQAIIESEDDQGTPRPFVEDEEPWEGFGMEEDEILDQNVAFFDEHLAALALAADGDVFLAATSGDENTSTRRVHFNISDTDSNDDEEDSFFPDIFLPKDELDSSFRREIDRDDGDGLMSDGSWEYNDHELAEDEIARAIEENEDDEDEDGSDADSNSSGYDSDESGYTTDEDLPAAARFAAPRVLNREPSHVSQTSTEEEVRRSPVGRVPKLGVWTVSNNKPFMVAKNNMKLVMFNRNAGQRRFSADAITHTPMQTPARINRIIDSSPMISNSGNIMMSAMADFGDPFSFGNQFLSGQALGPPEAFYPFTSIDANGNMAQDSSSAYDEDDMSDDDPWNVEDFLEFGEEESDNDHGEDVEHSSDSPGGDVPSSTPARPTTARSEDQVHPLLDHFDKGVVGSFRRNQNRHQLLTRNVASRDSLAFGGTHLDGTIRGVKSGRLHHANTPITPARKAKNLKPVIPSSPASPLAQLNKKRRYDGQEFNGHKRHRSLI